MWFVWFATAASLLPSACSDSPVDPEIVEEPVTLHLVRIDGHDVPFDDGPLTSRRGGISACHLIVTGGALSLDPSLQRYALYYTYRSSCDGHILNQLWDVGRYRRSGESLVFEYEGDLPNYSGAVRGDTIRVDFYETRLVFADAVPGVPPLGGSFPLVGLAQSPIPLPSDSAPPEPVECPPAGADGATLILEPDGIGGGRFELRVEIRDSCSGRLQTYFDESGGYEQVARSLLFTGEPSPGVVHFFQGEIREDSIVLLMPTLGDLIFRR